jgi:hypothetical protein
MSNKNVEANSRHASSVSTPPKQRKVARTIKKYLTGALGTGALASATVVPGRLAENLFKNRKTISTAIKSATGGGKGVRAGLAGIGKGIKNAADVRSIQPRKSMEEAFVRGSVGGGIGTFLTSRWNKSDAKKETDRTIDKVSRFISRKITPSTEYSSYLVSNRLNSYLAEFKDEKKPVVPNPTKTAGEKYLDWKAKKRLLGFALRNHGKLEKQGASKKLQGVKDRLGAASTKYNEVADIATRRLRQVGAVAAATGRAGVADLAGKASGFMERSKSFMPQKLKEAEDKVGGAKRAFDAITLAKNIGKGTLMAGAGAGALALGAKTAPGKRLVQSIKNRMAYKGVVKGARNAVTGKGL